MDPRITIWNNFPSFENLERWKWCQRLAHLNSIRCTPGAHGISHASAAMHNLHKRYDSFEISFQFHSQHGSLYKLYSCLWNTSHADSLNKTIHSVNINIPFHKHINTQTCVIYPPSKAEWCTYASVNYIIGSDNGLAPVRHQSIIWTNVSILLILLLGTNFRETVIKIQQLLCTRKGMWNLCMQNGGHIFSVLNYWYQT